MIKKEKIIALTQEIETKANQIESKEEGLIKNIENIQEINHQKIYKIFSFLQEIETEKKEIGQIAKTFKRIENISANITKKIKEKLLELHKKNIIDDNVYKFKKSSIKKVLDQKILVQNFKEGKISLNDVEKYFVIKAKSLLALGKALNEEEMLSIPLKAEEKDATVDLQFVKLKVKVADEILKKGKL